MHVLTHALHYGSAVFEGKRAYDGEIFKLTEHNQRLHSPPRFSTSKCRTPSPSSTRPRARSSRANNLSDAYIRPLAWRGSEQMGVSAQKTKINVAIAAWEWGSYFDPAAREKGMRLTFAKYRRPDPRPRRSTARRRAST